MFSHTHSYTYWLFLLRFFTYLFSYWLFHSLLINLYFTYLLFHSSIHSHTHLSYIPLFLFSTFHLLILSITQSFSYSPLHLLACPHIKSFTFLLLHFSHVHLLIFVQFLTHSIFNPLTISPYSKPILMPSLNHSNFHSLSLKSFW